MDLSFWAIAAIAALCGAAGALLVCVPAARLIRREGKRLKLKSVTRILFITTQIAALCWVSVSYLIAIYATVRLGQVFPVVDLSKQAITTILGVSVLKVAENIFEHNDGAVFGSNNKKAVPELDTEEEVKRDC